MLLSLFLPLALITQAPPEAITFRYNIPNWGKAEYRVKTSLEVGLEETADKVVFEAKFSMFSKGREGSKHRVVLWAEDFKYEDPNMDPEDLEVMGDFSGGRSELLVDRFGIQSEMMHEGFSEKGAMQGGLPETVGFLGIRYPEKPLAEGDTWSFPAPLEALPGELPIFKGKTVDIIYKLDKVELRGLRKVAMITANLAWKDHFDIPVEGGENIPADLNLVITIKHEVDVLTGLPFKSRFENDMKMSAPGEENFIVKGWSEMERIGRI